MNTASGCSAYGESKNLLDNLKIEVKFPSYGHAPVAQLNSEVNPATTSDTSCMAAQTADDGFVASAEWMQMLVEKLEFPENWEIMTMIQQNYWIETQIMLRKHQQRQRELMEKQAQQMQQSQAASLAAWQQRASAQPAAVFGAP